MNAGPASLDFFTRNVGARIFELMLMILYELQKTLVSSVGNGLEPGVSGTI